MNESITERTQYDEWRDQTEAAHAQATRVLLEQIEDAKCETVDANMRTADAEQRLKSLLSGLSVYAAGTPEGENELLHAVLQADHSTASRAKEVERFLLTQSLGLHRGFAEAVEARLKELR